MECANGDVDSLVGEHYTDCMSSDDSGVSGSNTKDSYVKSQCVMRKRLMVRKGRILHGPEGAYRRGVGREGNADEVFWRRFGCDLKMIEWSRGASALGDQEDTERV